jgi:hypothetical protein
MVGSFFVVVPVRRTSQAAFDIAGKSCAKRRNTPPLRFCSSFLRKQESSVFAVACCCSHPFIQSQNRKSLDSCLNSLRLW